jgi:hypothetical protein
MLGSFQPDGRDAESHVWRSLWEPRRLFQRYLLWRKKVRSLFCLLNADLILSFSSINRRYLHSSQQPPPQQQQSQYPSNILEPPPDFMTLRQKKHSIILKKAGVQLLTQKIEFKKSGDSDEAAMKLALLKRLEAMNKKKVLVIRTEPSTESEWKRQTQAGCTFWVHKTSGVISITRPFDVESDSSVCSSLDDSSLFSESHAGDDDLFGFLNEESEEDSIATATGSMVYDPKPFDSLMKELDDMDHSQSNRGDNFS